MSRLVPIPPPDWLRQAFPPAYRQRLLFSLDGSGEPTASVGIRASEGQVFRVKIRRDDGSEAYLRRAGLAFFYNQIPGHPEEEQKRVHHFVIRRVLDACAKEFDRVLSDRSCEERVLARLRSIDDELDVRVLYIHEQELQKMSVDEAVERVREVPRAAGLEVRLFFDNFCDQACKFCLLPVLRRGGFDNAAGPLGAELLAAVVRELEARFAERSRIVLSGPDCLRHPKLAEMLASLASLRAVGCGFIGPCTALSDPGLVEQIAALPTLQAVDLTLLSLTPEVHDDLVGAPGAQVKVIAAIENLRAANIEVAAHVILTPSNILSAPALIAWLAERGVLVLLKLYHPENWPGESPTWEVLDQDALVVGPEQVAALFGPENVSVLRAAHYQDIPLCWMHEEVRALPRRRVETDLQADFDKPAKCAGCALSHECAGITVPAARAHGDDIVTPISR